MKKILVVTHNAGKVVEFQTILKDYQVVSLRDLNINLEIEENGNNYYENALTKVKALMGYDDYIIVADDSGIEIDILNKRPGIYSARYLGEETPYEVKNSQIMAMLKDETNRKASFKCGIVAKIKDKYHYFEGELHGEIALSLKGNQGFGYDPIFYLPELKKTTAELDNYGKNELSHRRKALEKLAKFLKDENI